MLQYTSNSYIYYCVLEERKCYGLKFSEPIFLTYRMTSIGHDKPSQGIRSKESSVMQRKMLLIILTNFCSGMPICILAFTTFAGKTDYYTTVKHEEIGILYKNSGREGNILHDLRIFTNTNEVPSFL